MADNEQQQIVVVKNSDSVLGILSIVFSIIGIFVFAPIFATLGLIFAIVAIYYEDQVGLGVTGFILGVIALLLSPMFWSLLNYAVRYAQRFEFF